MVGSQNGGRRRAHAAVATVAGDPWIPDGLQRSEIIAGAGQRYPVDPESVLERGRRHRIEASRRDLRGIESRSRFFGLRSWGETETDGEIERVEKSVFWANRNHAFPPREDRRSGFNAPETRCAAC